MAGKCPRARYCYTESCNTLRNTITISDLIFDTDVISDQPNTAEILAAKFKTSEPRRYYNESCFYN